MTSGNDNAAVDGGGEEEGDEMARALRASFEREAERRDTSVRGATPWSLTGLFSDTAAGNGGIGNGSGSEAPMSAAASTPDTAASTPSPMRAMGRLSYLEFLQRGEVEAPAINAQNAANRGRPQGSPRSSLRSTPRRSPRSSPRPRRLSSLEVLREEEEEKRQRQEKYSLRGSPRASPRSSPRPSPRSTLQSSPRSSPRSFSQVLPTDWLGSIFDDGTGNDKAVARKLDQELRDAEMARSLTKAERSSAFGRKRSGDFAVDCIPIGNIAPRRQRSDSFNDTPSTRALRGGAQSDDRCSKIRYYGLRVLLSTLLACIAMIIYLTIFGKNISDGLDPASWLPGYPEKDPGLGTVGEHNLWRPLRDEKGEIIEGHGLSLTILNNLRSGSDWNEYLTTTLSEWDRGIPDAVSFGIRTIARDPDCRAVRRAMKVCNADYGPTEWRGVNQILLQDDMIVTSLAKVNDYYLEGTNRAQKMYTMCHEFGHGLGLGHTDENFHNEDLGNCMDYTERPENNMHPDTPNFQSLAELYGLVDGTSLKVQKLQTSDGGERGRSLGDAGGDEDEFERYAARLSDPIAVSSLRGHDKVSGEEGSWRLLRKTGTAELHERRLGDGYSIRASLLLA
ncbi:hypothetical protein ACHAWF_005072 [Thalassiosira exigua]